MFGHMGTYHMTVERDCEHDANNNNNNKLSRHGSPGSALEQATQTRPVAALAILSMLVE